MRTLLISAAALALSFGAVSANAQEQKTTTTTVESPTGTTTTKTTESTDAYGTYRKTVTSTQSYDAGPFDAPPGFTYHRFGLGDHVPAALVDRDSIDDYGNYRLSPPPGGLVWIRDGRDALLVDNNDVVVQADYDVFNAG